MSLLLCTQVIIVFLISVVRQKPLVYIRSFRCEDLSSFLAEFISKMLEFLCFCLVFLCCFVSYLQIKVFESIPVCFEVVRLVLINLQQMSFCRTLTSIEEEVTIIKEVLNVVMMLLFLDALIQLVFKSFIVEYHINEDGKAMLQKLEVGKMEQLIYFSKMKQN